MTESKEPAGDVLAAERPTVDVPRLLYLLGALFVALGVAGLLVVAWTSYRGDTSKAGATGHSDMTSTAASLQPKAAALIEAVSHGHARVVSTFAGPDGLLGAVVENPASKQRDIAWFSPRANVLLDGGLLGSHGEDLNREAKIQQGLILSPLETLKQVVAAPERRSIRTFVEGATGPLITVFFDPNCAYCHLFYDQLAPLVATGAVRVRYIVVGVVRPDSPGRAASILAAADPEKALADNERRYDAANEEGGYPIASTIDPALTAMVNDNTALFGKAGMSGTPTTLYCDKATGTVRLLAGVPTDLKAFITDAGRCP